MFKRAMHSALLACVLVAGVSLAADEKAAVADLVLKGDARCTKCHDENDAPQVLSIGKTKHGVGADKRTPTCSSCHGNSDLHVEKAGRGSEKAPAPDVAFSKKAKSTAEQRSQACLSCHQGEKRMHWAGSAHSSGDVACTSCHNIHAQRDNVRHKPTQAEVCYACHKEQRAMANRQSRHPTKEGKVVCSDCHSLHGTAGPKLLVRDTVNDTCFSCHMEKRGPFVWQHQPATEDCSICHNPHGSNNDAMLKSRAPFLCQECHEPTSHRGNVPGNGTVTSSAGNSTSNGFGLGQARSCMSCHNQLHGTNNPTNTTSGGSPRTMRR